MITRVPSFSLFEFFVVSPGKLFGFLKIFKKPNSLLSVPVHRTLVRGLVTTRHTNDPRVRTLIEGRYGGFTQVNRSSVDFSVINLFNTIYFYQEFFIFTITLTIVR